MKKKILSVMITALIMVTFVACGNVSDVISNLKPDDDVEVETSDEEEDSETAEGFSDTSMDGGAPASEETTETVSEETTEVVVPVETTFTLMSEDGSAVAFEGTVPEGLTLVSGNGTNHIEFAYDENTDVIVYLDAGVDNDVLACNEININQCLPQVLEKYPINEDVFTESNVTYNSSSAGCAFTINGEGYVGYAACLEHFIYGCDYDMDGHAEYYAIFGCACHDGDAPNDAYGYEVDPNSDEFGYRIWKMSILADSHAGNPIGNPFTFTIRIDQPDFASLTEDDIEIYYRAGYAYEEFAGGRGDAFASDIFESFSN